MRENKTLSGHIFDLLCFTPEQAQSDRLSKIITIQQQTFFVNDIEIKEIMDSNLKSYQSLYASLTAEITANLSKITQNLKSKTLPEDAIGKKF